MRAGLPLLLLATGCSLIIENRFDTAEGGAAATGTTSTAITTDATTNAIVSTSSSTGPTPQCLPLDVVVDFDRPEATPPYGVLFPANGVSHGTVVAQPTRAGAGAWEIVLPKPNGSADYISQFTVTDARAEDRDHWLAFSNRYTTSDYTRYSAIFQLSCDLMVDPYAEANTFMIELDPATLATPFLVRSDLGATEHLDVPLKAGAAAPFYDWVVHFNLSRTEGVVELFLDDATTPLWRLDGPTLDAACPADSIIVRVGLSRSDDPDAVLDQTLVLDEVRLLRDPDGPLTDVRFTLDPDSRCN